MDHVTIKVHNRLNMEKPQSRKMVQMNQGGIIVHNKSLMDATYYVGDREMQRTPHYAKTW
jgi:hypothetical protein